MKSPLFPVTLAFCAGILLSRSLSSPISQLLLTTLALLLVMWLLWLMKKTVLFFGVALLTFLSIGALWPLLHEASFEPNHLRTLVKSGRIDLAEPCRVTGICSKSSVQRGIGEQAELEVDQIENRYSRFFTRGKVRLALYYQKLKKDHDDSHEPRGQNFPNSLEASHATGASSQGAPAHPVLEAGDRIEVLANLTRPKNFNNPGQFDYVSYLERQGVFLVGTIKNDLLITKLAADQGSFLIKPIWKLRAALLNQLNVAFTASEEVKAALRALLLGEKQGLSPQVEESFQATGIYHVLVISGQHVAIMAAFFFGFFKILHLPKGASVPLTMLGLVTYCLVTEAQPSIVRSTLMSCLFLIGLSFDRDRSLLNSLSTAALALLLVDPFWLFDPGFQLSFLAVLSIALIGLPLLRHTTQPYRNALWQIEEASLDAQFSPRLADFRIALRMKIESLRNQWTLKSFNLNRHTVISALKVGLYLADVLLISVSIQLVFFALMILYFHRVSLLSVFLNVLVVPLVGLIVPVGLLSLLLSFIAPMASLVVAKLCGWLTYNLLLLAQYFASPSWGNYRIPTPPEWLVIMYFLSLSFFLFFSYKKIIGALCGCVAAPALMLLLLHPFNPTFVPNRLEVTFLDVRQGDSIFLQFPDNSNMLIDGGGLLGRSFGEDFSEETFDVGEQVVSPFLWSLGLKALDAVVLTHAHHDHMAGLYSILNNFQVNEIWLGQNPYTPEYVRLLKRAIRKDVILRRYASGDKRLFHGGEMVFLNPGKDHHLSSVPSNNDSLAFQLRFGARAFLLTGDIEKKIENQIISNHVPINSNVLKVAHHGSRSSTTDEFLARVNPMLAVISVAEHSPFGHPHAEVLTRLRRKSIEVFRTDQHGAITISTDGNQLTVSTFLR